MKLRTKQMVIPLLIESWENCSFFGWRGCDQTLCRKFRWNCRKSGQKVVVKSWGAKGRRSLFIISLPRRFAPFFLLSFTFCLSFEKIFQVLSSNSKSLEQQFPFFKTFPVKALVATTLSQETFCSAERARCLTLHWMSHSITTDVKQKSFSMLLPVSLTFF